MVWGNWSGGVLGLLRLDAVHVRNIVGGHQARENGHHHFGLDLGDVLGQGVHPGAQLSCHRDGVLCVRVFILKIAEHTNYDLELILYGRKKS